MLSRTDARQTLTEAFTFDTLDRLTSAQVGTHPTANYNFDVTGSMTEKSDVGLAYLYTGTQPHAVTQITQSGGQPPNTFGYDANGNMDVVDGSPMITWSSYNKPTQIASGGITYNFSYGPDRKRFKKTRNGTITHYVGTSFETIDPGLGIDTYRHYIRANGKTVMIREDVAGTVSHRYIHRDHLGSVTAITDEATGSVIERYSYDAWGKRRSASDWQSAVTSTQEDRGYTGHEHLDDVGVIHMNGRVYSPSLGRMLSPDPITQSPENGQNYNRYSYAYNNPLKYTDPSGYEIEDSAQIDYPFPTSDYPSSGNYRPHALDELFARTMAYNMRKGAEGVARAILEYLQQNPATMERFLASVEKKYGDVTDHKEEAVRIPESIGEGQSRLDSLLVEFKDLTMQNVSEYHEIFNVIAGLEIKYDPEWDGEARCCKANRITVGPRFFTSGGIPREATVEQRAYLKTLTPHQRRLFMLAHEAAHGTKENRRVARKNPGRYRREIDPVEINATKQAIAWAKTVFKE